VRAALIIVEPPGFDDELGLGERGELVYVYTFVSQSSVKRFNQGVFHRCAGPNTVELHALPIGPIFERPRLEFGDMIHRAGPWAWRPVQNSIKDLADWLHPTSEHRPLVQDFGDSGDRRPSKSETAVHWGSCPLLWLMRVRST